VIALVALVVSLAALAVSWVGLYLTSLSPAEIEVDHVNQPHELESGGFTGSQPMSHRISLAIFISNAGARAGLLEALGAENFEWRGDGQPYWAGISRCDIRRGTRAPIVMPMGLEAGDVKSALLDIELQPTGGSLEDMARQLSGMREVAVTISWKFVRTKGLPVRWRAIPTRYQRNRETVKRSTAIVIDASEYRRLAIDHWQRQPDGARLIELAQGEA
jgi:hypothetical protein